MVRSKDVIMQGLALCAYVALLMLANLISMRFQRRIQLEGLAFGFAATGLLTFSWGFFEDAGAARLPTFWILPIMAGLWGLGVLLANWRFR